MARTLDDLEKLLTDRGYPCRRVHDSFLVTQVSTSAYTNATGGKSIELHLGFDEGHGCLTMLAPWAFDARRAAHREAMFSCLLTASGGAPLVKAQLDPKDGEVRLRVDCRLGADGVGGDEVLSMLDLIPAFADRWYPHIKDAMEKGRFDAAPAPTPADERLESFARRCGGVNRIAALLRMRNRQGRGGADGADPAAN